MKDAREAPRLFTGLTEAQADGLACVVCGTEYLKFRVTSRPVGRSHTDSQVFACVGKCAGLLGLVDDPDTREQAEAALTGLADIQALVGIRALEIAISLLTSDRAWNTRMRAAIPEMDSWFDEDMEALMQVARVAAKVRAAEFVAGAQGDK